MSGRRETPGSGAPVTVVVPIHNAVDDLRRCVESVLAHTAGDYRLVLIDDASPDPAIGEYFAALARRPLPHLTLLKNERNLGFTGTANRGMASAPGDVVLLNSDTVVTAGWLDALARCAAADPRIGTITPFSNNAEICSFPRFCADNPWPDGADPEPVRAALAGAAVPTYPDLPTGVGFCLYVRRALIDAIGLFDLAFGAGYGEENDFCMRAAAAGWRNVLADDAFVLHLGGRSFAGRKAELGARNMALLLERHPRYLDVVRDYIAADPLRPLRDAALARLRLATGPARGVLHVIHGHGGGTEHHARALIEGSRGRYRHHLAIAVGDAWQWEEHLDDRTVRTYDFRRGNAESWPEFLGGLAATFGIDVIHLHNISMCRDGMLEALAALGLPYGYTVHDLNFACPTITFLGTDGLYCGTPTDPQVCAACLLAQPAFAPIDIVRWRARHAPLLEGAAFLIAPSRWVAATLRRYFPGCEAEVVPHAAPGVWAVETQAAVPRAEVAEAGPPSGIPLPDDDVPTIAVLGAVGPDKGARRLERLAELVRERGARVRFVLIGYLDAVLRPWQSEDAVLTVHGRYAPAELPRLLDAYRARLVAFPSAGPETFSFTLSEAWAAGRAVVVPPFGALAERVGDHGAGWIWTDEEWRSEARMLDRLLQLVAAENAAALAQAGEQARAVPQPTLPAMADRTVARYEAAVAAAAPQRCAPFAPARVRDALGYAPWTPPVDVPATPAVPTPTAEVASASTCDVASREPMAQRWRRSLPGRIVLAPARVLAALRSRKHR
jgi:GT2 family glycosyltransferase/glycosyltransferase involved in cell wall biosynthesis